MDKRINLNVGLIGVGLNTYWAQFEDLQSRLLGYQQTIRQRMEMYSVNVIDGGLLDSPQKVQNAANEMTNKHIEILFVYISTYALSSLILPLAQQCKVPIIFLNVQPVAAIDYKYFNSLPGRKEMTGEWLAHCQACSVPEFAAVLKPEKLAANKIYGPVKTPEGQYFLKVLELDGGQKAEFAKADAEEAALSDGENGEDMNLGKEFYTIEAASGKVFYLIIDRDGQEEMVYFLTEITENDLLNVTTDNSETLPKNSAALESQIPVTESALPNNNTDIDDTHEVETPTETPEEPQETETEEPAEEEPEEPVKSNPLLGYIIMAIFGGGVIGAAYYFKVVKKKQDGDFVEDEDEEAEEAQHPEQVAAGLHDAFHRDAAVGVHFHEGGPFLAAAFRTAGEVVREDGLAVGALQFLLYIAGFDDLLFLDRTKGTLGYDARMLFHATASFLAESFIPAFWRI